MELHLTMTDYYTFCSSCEQSLRCRYICQSCTTSAYKQTKHSRLYLTCKTIRIFHTLMATSISPLSLLSAIPRSPDTLMVPRIQVLLILRLRYCLSITPLRKTHLRKPLDNISLFVVFHIVFVFLHDGNLFVLPQRHSIPLFELLFPHLLQLFLSLLHLLLQQR